MEYFTTESDSEHKKPIKSGSFEAYLDQLKQPTRVPLPLETKPTINDTPEFYEALNTEPKVPNRHRMIDPSERIGEDASAAYYRSETLKPAPKAETHAETEIEDQLITEETYRVPRGQRSETSIWHRYQVDAKSGRLAEDYERNYGEAYRQEKQPEQLKRKVAQPYVARQIGHTIVNDIGTDSKAPSLVPTSSSLNEPTQTQTPTPNPIRNLLNNNTTQFIIHQLKLGLTDPATWLVAGGIVVLLFVFGIL